MIQAKPAFKSVKEVKNALLNKCFYVYVLISESKIRVIDIKTEKGQIKVKTLGWKWWDSKKPVHWMKCTLEQLIQQ